MRVLEVTGFKPDKLGGFERFFINFSNHLIRNGHEHAIFFDGEPVSSLRDALVDLDVAFYNRKFHNIGVKDALFLARFIRKNKIDIVHLHFCGTPYNMFTFIGVFLPCKIYMTYHMAISPTSRPTLLQLLKKVRNRILGIGINRFICVSNFGKDKFVDTYHERANKVSVVYNGISVEGVPVRKDEGLQIGRYKLICVASLTQQKGISDLLHAVAIVVRSIPFVEVTIVGTGPKEKELHQLANDLEIEGHVKFLGLRSDVPLLLSKSDVAVVPSQYDEAFGFSVIEAMAAKVPIIATRVGGIPEIINAETGILVSGKSPEDIAKALMLLHSDYERGRHLASEAHKIVKERFSISVTCENYLQIYSKDFCR